jgi:hypothetical protein
MAQSGFLDELTTSTRRHILPGITDGVFRNDPLLAYVKKNNLEKFPGGSGILVFLLDGVLRIAGAYTPGESFTLSTAQIDTGASFQPKFYGAPIVMQKEQMQVYNKGAAAVFKLIDVRLQAAAMTVAAMLAIDFYNDGQAALRTKRINGLAEMLNDGSVASWNGSAYTTYGTLTRGGTIGSALSSPMTAPAASVAGPITYKILEEAYNSVCIGDEHPNLIVTTNLGMSYIKEKFQPQWRTESTDPNIGFAGLKFNGAMVMQSQYCPGTTAPEQAAALGWTTVSAGETIFFLNTKYLRMYISDDPEFAFGFTGFKPQFDGTLVGGQYLAALNVTQQSPRHSRHLYAITG